MSSHRSTREVSLEALHWPHLLRPRDLVVWGQPSAEPTTLVALLMQAGVKIGGMGTFICIGCSTSAASGQCRNCRWTLCRCRRRRWRISARRARLARRFADHRFAVHADSDNRIVSRLSGPFSTARSDVGLVVTERGSADLRGLALAPRREAMIAIAAPEHRSALADTPPSTN
jgi:hypothetical protein